MKKIVKNKKHIQRLLCVFILFIVSTQSVHAISNKKQDIPHILTIAPNQEIQKCIDSAPINATIIFQNGTYDQPIHIKKPMILVGSKFGNTILKVETKPNNPAIIISSSFATLRNLTITNTAPGLYTSAVRVDSSKVFISNCHIKNTPIGISTWKDQITISNSTFTNCSDEGIALISTSISTSNRNVIKDCIFIRNGDGIELQHSSNNMISHCTFDNSTHAGIDAIRDNNNNNTIYNCTFINNDVFDIYFSSSKYNQISNCDMKKSSNSIVFNPSTSTNTISIQSSIPSNQHNEEINHTLAQEGFSFKQQLVQSLLKGGHDLIITLITNIKMRLLRQ